ncbi:DUF1553 domain-containing protein [Planctomycetota bacterium]
MKMNVINGVIFRHIIACAITTCCFGFTLLPSATIADERQPAAEETVRNRFQRQERLKRKNLQNKRRRQALGQAKNQQEFFESKIRPVLVEHCYECHSEKSEEIGGGFVLDTREGIRRGGESGEAVVPKNVADSLLIGAMRYDTYEMPPSGPLPDTVVRDFERWVRMGAPDPRDGKAAIVRPTVDIEAGREFWAFQPIQAPPIPRVESAWAETDIDHFIAAKHVEHGLIPVGVADRGAWLRRVSIDLTGLPPKPKQISAFINDKSPQAIETVVDRLLASDQFGERWGRHWLDVARFAESVGKTRNFPLTFAWRYRDYVIDAFHNDMPYDQFVREQLAGDLLPADTDQDRNRQLIATGFLAIGSHDLNEGNTNQFEMDIVGEQIDVVSRSLMGLTVGCARCHDHKFDPIPTTDYYAMAGIFRSTQLLTGYTNKRRQANYFVADRFHELPGYERSATAAEEPAADPPQKRNGQLARLRKQMQELNVSIKQVRRDNDLSKGERKEKVARLEQRRRQLQKRIRNANQQPKGRKPPTGALAIGVTESDTIADCKINLRGDPKKLGGRVDRGFLQIASLSQPVSIPDSTSGRLELANWLVDGRHPLTARVMVNRVWQHMFGEGLVRTVDNFGEMGEGPTHPELLDYLANRFMQEGWSVKRLVREIAISRTYRLSSDVSEANANIDGDNRFLWKVSRRRLDAEGIRDTIMMASGSLELRRPNGSMVASYPITENGRIRGSQVSIDQPIRSIYLPVIRNGVDEFFTVFDFPDPSEVRGRRDVTTVPTQALFMMNSSFVAEQSRAAAQRLLDQSKNDRARIVAAYRRTVSRTPTDDEIKKAIQYVTSVNKGDNRDRQEAELAAWTEVCHALFASAEFRYR